MDIINNKLEQLSILTEPTEVVTTFEELKSNTRESRSPYRRLRSYSEPNHHSFSHKYRRNQTNCDHHTSPTSICNHQEALTLAPTPTPFVFHFTPTDYALSSEKLNSSLHSTQIRTHPRAKSAMSVYRSMSRYRPYPCRDGRKSRSSCPMYRHSNDNCSFPSTATSETTVAYNQLVPESHLTNRNASLGEMDDRDALLLRVALARSHQGMQHCAQEMQQASHSPTNPLADGYNVNELAAYFDDFLHLPQKMSFMAESMYA